MRLSDFPSVFELSIAIHIAYSLLDAVRLSALQRFQDSVQYLKEYRSRFDPTKVSTDTLEYKMANFERTWINATNELRPLIRRFSFLSILVAVFSLACLIFAGFKPDAEWSGTVILILLALALFPMPLFLVITRLVAQKYVADLSSLSNSVRIEFSRLSEQQSKQSDVKKV